MARFARRANDVKGLWRWQLFVSPWQGHSERDVVGSWLFSELEGRSRVGFSGTAGRPILSGISNRSQRMRSTYGVVMIEGWSILARRAGKDAVRQPSSGLAGGEAGPRLVARSGRY